MYIMLDRRQGNSHHQHYSDPKVFCHTKKFKEKLLDKTKFVDR